MYNNYKNDCDYAAFRESLKGWGWKTHVRPLVDYCEAHNICICQIKEKFGGLRFYTAGHTKDFQKLLEAAEIACDKTCEFCGDPGKLRSGDWLTVRCDKCEAIHEADRQNKDS